MEVLAFNSEGYLSSRGADAGVGGEGRRKGESNRAVCDCGRGFGVWRPVAVATVCGEGCTGHGPGDQDRASRLFGASKVHIQLLTTDNGPLTTPPTKENFRKAFDEVRQKAKPEDVVVVYLAGHGVSLSRATILVLLRHAGGAEPRSGGPGRPGATQSDNDYQRRAGRVDQADSSPKAGPDSGYLRGRSRSRQADRETRYQRRSDSRTDRLKDRTGFHVLLGCASDRVSYEASRYEQGLLTYSLLSGMRGAAPREGEFVDVSKLFQYSADEVPQLAKDIGGIQAPMIFAAARHKFRCRPAQTGGQANNSTGHAQDLYPPPAAERPGSRATTRRA